MLLVVVVDVKIALPYLPPFPGTTDVDSPPRTLTGWSYKKSCCRVSSEFLTDSRCDTGPRGRKGGTGAAHAAVRKKESRPDASRTFPMALERFRTSAPSRGSERD